MELLILLFLVVFVLAVAGIVVSILKRGRPAPTGWGTGDLRDRVNTLVWQQQPIQAIKVLRQATGLGLADAKRVVDAVAGGADLWEVPIMARYRPAHLNAPAPVDARPDLASRVRELKAGGRAEQAVHLVRGETGMDQDEAERFVDAL
ncbi:hypothetical protein Sru01_66970 [Sphaerisporangium rufum]|uniref:Large ribosomal subunit protein bL12 C-terminal domain-containing protein n=2 Tax=Sphaerisporangium rufum TaxID=1381558 RepID=A0A919RBJ5_9ACTN|nr:hypothetical protein Sru01_66970 [Sphaerisporangium rufum]